MVIHKLRLIMAFFGIMLATILGACGKQPVPQDVYGLWINSDGSQLLLDESGKFSAYALPVSVFTSPDRKGPPFSGSGTWRIQKNSPYWEVYLGFDEIDGHSDSLGTALLVAGSGSSLYLYQWVEEEGGARYTFSRAK
jgi:hypothetical protein